MKFFCLGAVLLTWPLIPFGAYVRLKNAGLSCPDWPLCYGMLIPPSGFEIWLEVGHRFFAVLLGIFIIAITIFTFLGAKFSHFRRLSVCVLFLVCFQGIIGALTVTMTLWPPIVNLHLLVANLIFGILVYLCRLVFEENYGNKKRISKINEALNKKRMVNILNTLKLMTIIFFVILFSGGYNSSTYSGNYCEAFPGCHEGSELSFSLSGKDISFISGFKDHVLPHAPPEFQGRFFPEYEKEWINMIHRFIAIIGGTVIIFMAWFSLNKKFGYNLIGNSIVFLLFFEKLYN